MKMKIPKIIYAAIFVLAFLLPGIMTFARRESAVGNEQNEDLKDAGYLNFAQKFDKSFSQNFGFRSTLIEWNNRLKYGLFGQSGEDSVIVGRDGWLFYEEALHDFAGEDVLTDEEIREIASALKKTQDYVEGRGAAFVFVSAPNKMEIYGKNMPYYCVENTDDGNYEHLMSALEEQGVNYVDLKKLLKAEAEDSDILLYHRLDSHWNNLGASLAYTAITEKIGCKAYDYSALDYSVSESFDGDLYGMLFPKGQKKDEQVIFDRQDEFDYTSNFRDVDDVIIDTFNENGKGRLLMFRDSFGNALYPFFANDFCEAEFSRALPYDLTYVEGYDVVVIEIVERNIANMLEYPPVIGAAD